MSLPQLIKVPEKICDYPSQPRSALDPDYCRGLGENMKANGQKVPVIGYMKGDRFILCDGGCRLEGARLVGITELLAIDLGKEPTRLELLMAQASIDLHRQHLPPIDRARLFASLCKEQGCTARKLAEMLHVSEAVISRAIALLELPGDIQRQVNEGKLDARRGYLLSQESDPERQRELASQATALSRDELAKRVRKPKAPGTPQVRLKRIVCPLPSGVSITVSGTDLSLDDFAEALAEARREVMKAREQSLDVKTFAAVMRDKAKLGGAR
ncbi:MAG TPA: ParB/RepB/Spo0J family partition protein [Burkholderiaceae bacterium]|nr:ParB/RepB/Spo0J family partition protein [Burkholderiaceae bacterium]